MADEPTPPRLPRHSKYGVLALGARWPALALLLCIGLFAPELPSPASASPLPAGLATAQPPTSQVELAQYRRRAFAKMKKKRLAHRRREQVAGDDAHKAPPGNDGPPNHAPPGGPKNSDPPGGLQHNDPPGGPPAHHASGQPSRPRQPRLPPVVIPPNLTTEQAETLRALPRRVLQRPRGASLRQRVDRQILVLFDQARAQSIGGELARRYGLELLSSRPVALLRARAELFRVRGGRSEAAALAALRRDRRVRSAQFNWRYFHSDDDRHDAAPIPQYGPQKLRLPEAHRLALGRNVPIAVIDSAVDTAHPDFEGAAVETFDAVGGPDAEPDFHGTAVAGIIRSRHVVEGVAPQARIMAVRAFRSKPGALPETTTEILLGAIDWAVRNGARVLNLSFVGPKSGQLQELLDATRRKGVVLVAAAGNGGPKAPPAFPAAFPGVIAVTAVDAADRRYEHANRGHYIAVAAPGVDILAPVEGGKHELVSGTSFATAYVSGIAALLLERDPGLDAAGVARLIAAGADDLGPRGRDDDFGAGRVNALTTLKSMHAVAAR
jgi:subtilisin family serine protease